MSFRSGALGALGGDQVDCNKYDSFWFSAYRKYKDAHNVYYVKWQMGL